MFTLNIIGLVAGNKTRFHCLWACIVYSCYWWPQN